MAELDLNMSLYDANREIMKTMAPVPESKMKIDLAGIGAWMSKFPSAKYFMLLCREKADYTMFHLNRFNYMRAVEELREVLESRGTLLGVNYIHGEDTYECWIREEGPNPQVHMYMLFEATDFVIEIDEKY